ncbi:MAG: hypothetical protein RSB77_03605 [Bacilli bacterium]
METKDIEIKTMKDWKYDFGTDFKPGDRVDNEIYEHFLNVLPPLVYRSNMLQVSEPYGWDSRGGSTYTTFINDGISWVYKGHCFKNQTEHIH